jgi:hypothetical protein
MELGHWRTGGWSILESERFGRVRTQLRTVRERLDSEPYLVHLVYGTVDRTMEFSNLTDVPVRTVALDRTTAALLSN